MKHIGIVGSFGSGNIGDEAAWISVKDFLVSKIGLYKYHTHIFQWGEPNLVCNYHTSPLYFWTDSEIDWINENFEALIITGGGIVGWKFGLTTMPKLHYILERLKVPIYTVSVSAEKGEYSNESLKCIRLLKEKSTIFTVRDEFSHDILETLGFGKTRITPDVVTALESCAMQGKHLEKKIVMVMASNCLQDSFVKFWKELYNYKHFKDNITMISFVPSSNDINAIQYVSGKLGFVQSTPQEVQKLIKEADFVVAGRLHAAVIAANVGTPFFAINYHPKVASFCKSIGHQFYYPMETDNLPLDITKYGFEYNNFDIKEALIIAFNAWNNLTKPEVKYTAHGILEEVYDDIQRRSTTVTKPTA